MDERGDDAELGEHELHGRIDQPEPEQHRVEEAVIAEHDDPGIGAHHLAEEQRRDGDHQNCGLERDVSCVHQRVGERVADEQREERREKADPHRLEKHPRIERPQQRGEVVEREASRFQRAGHICAQAVLHHRRERGGEAERAQHGRRHEQAQERPLAHLLAPERNARTRSLRAHAVSS